MQRQLIMELSVGASVVEVAKNSSPWGVGGVYDPGTNEQLKGNVAVFSVTFAGSDDKVTHLI